MFWSQDLRVLLIRGALVIGFSMSLVGYFMPESDLQDRERIKLFRKAFEVPYISIRQPAPGAPLEPEVDPFFKLKPSDQEYFGEKQWERIRRHMFRFVAAVNQGLGDPFEYRETEDARAIVTGVKEDALKYENPFTKRRLDYVTTPINSSEQVAHRRAGWRVVSKNLLLLVRPGGIQNIPVSSGAQELCDVGGSFILEGKSGNSRTLKLSGDARGLQLEQSGSSNQDRIINKGHGEYFIWEGRPFGVFRSDADIKDADDTSPGDLVFTKMVNGRAQRVQVLGRATANVIGSPVGGETGAIDGALSHERVQRLRLTLDPELQTRATFLLSAALKGMEKHPSRLKRSRRGVVSVLDATTGQVLVHVGAPAYDPEWEGQRIILANRRAIVDNPANAVHMPGSAIKVLTAGMGYLLYSDGNGNMLPTSINKLAIRQAFRNAYGGPTMPPSDIVDDTEDANVTAAGKKFFDDHGGKQHPLKADFVRALNMGFYTLHYTPAKERYQEGDETSRREYFEPLVPNALVGYFDGQAKYDFLPVRSRFPVQDADSMQIFRQMAIGGNEAQFTMLRLAANLGAVTSGQLIRPYLIESISDRAISTPKQQISFQRSEVFSDFRGLLRDIQGVHNGYEQIMMQQTEEYLKLVCNRGSNGTGWFLNTNGSKVFMNEDDPSAPGDESITRRNDFGKTGTADNGKLDEYDDSIFVYRHGRYLIGIWLERSDGPGIKHPAHTLLNEVVKFIDRLDPAQ